MLTLQDFFKEVQRNLSTGAVALVLQMANLQGQASGLSLEIGQLLTAKPSAGDSSRESAKGIGSDRDRKSVV